MWYAPDYGIGLLRDVKYFVARVYSYVHESTEVAEDHYHGEWGIHQFKLHLVHTEVGTNKKSIIWIRNWKSQMDKRMGNVQISREYLGSRLLKQWNLWNAMQIGDLNKN